MTTSAAHGKEVISLGFFSLVATHRLLGRTARVWGLSSRVYDILVALLSRPDQVVGKAI
jgi:DNA-binding winged helix-turn-helix (wHTH) protein